MEYTINYRSYKNIETQRITVNYIKSKSLRLIHALTVLLTR